MRRHVVALAFLMLASQAAAAQETLQPIQPAVRARPAVPVIVVPGVLGSRLVDKESGLERWPGSTRKLLTSGYRELALRIDPETLEPVDDGLVARGLFDAAAGQDFYRKIVATLQKAGGYWRGQPGERQAKDRANVYEFAYDWRQDNIVTVRKLDALIEQIRKDYGDPALKVDVIAHSMGGLIVRYYERYGTEDVLDRSSFAVSGAGLSKLRRIVLLGTPNLGTTNAVHSFLDGYRVGLSRLPTEGVATMPAMYQLFPHPAVDWIAGIDGRPLEHRLFDVETWRRFNWSIFDPRVRRRMAQHPETWPKPEVYERWFEKWLGRARGLAWSLMVPTADVRPIQPLVLGGDCVPTPRMLVIEYVNGIAVPRLTPEQIEKPQSRVDYERLMYEPGDGKVTVSSLLGGRQQGDPSEPDSTPAHVEISNATFDCQQHDTLTSNVAFIDQLLDYLLKIET